MMEFLQVLVLFVLCVCSESTIRDFSYPKVENFKVYWNVPTILCKTHGIDFEASTKKFGIISNPGDQFRGNQMSILYDPGMFPAMMKNSNGELKKRNGGIPQLGNLTIHLETFKKVVKEAVPEDFNGVGVIDFETWRPVFRQNWNDQTIYKNMSKDLERQRHPKWSEKEIETEAAKNFEAASRTFMESTLKLVKVLRPKGTWGYYGFPYCYNGENKETQCADFIERENNGIQWMFDESTAFYPSLYVSEKLTGEKDKQFVIARLNEARRMATRVSSKNPPLVHPYIWVRYNDANNFISKDDMYTVLETTRGYKMGGAIIWGASENVSSKEKCQSLLNYLNTVLGPTIEKVKKNSHKAVEAAEGVEEDQYGMTEGENEKGNEEVENIEEEPLDVDSLVL